MTDEVTTGYVHRTCLSCGKRLQRWIKGRENTAKFCDSGCGSHYRRTHKKTPKTSQMPHSDCCAETAQKTLVPQRLEPSIAATEGKPEYRPCRTCGRTSREVHCSTRCRDYQPLAARKPDGVWYVAAGPVSYCEGCGLAIVPGRGGILLPHRCEDGKLRCDECHTAPVKVKRASPSRFRSPRNASPRTSAARLCRCIN
jgi:hypothetical protein